MVPPRSWPARHCWLTGTRSICAWISSCPASQAASSLVTALAGAAGRPPPRQQGGSASRRPRYGSAPAGSGPPAAGNRAPRCEGDGVRGHRPIRAPAPASSPEPCHRTPGELSPRTSPGSQSRGPQPCRAPEAAARGWRAWQGTSLASAAVVLRLAGTADPREQQGPHAGAAAGWDPLAQSVSLAAFSRAPGISRWADSPGSPCTLLGDGLLAWPSDSSCHPHPQRLCAGGRIHPRHPSVLRHCGLQLARTAKPAEPEHPGPSPSGGTD